VFRQGPNHQIPEKPGVPRFSWWALSLGVGCGALAPTWCGHRASATRAWLGAGARRMQGSSGSLAVGPFFVVEVKSEVIIIDSHSRIK